MFKSGMLIIMTALVVFGLAHQAMAKERQGIVTIQVNLNAPADAKNTRLWVPYPMSDKNQDITGISVNGNYTGMGVYREPKEGVTSLYAEWKEPVRDRTLTYIFTVKRKEVVTRDFPKTELPISVEELKQYLDNSHLGDAEKRVKEIAAEITKDKKTVLDKSSAVYNWVVDNMRRDPNVKGCGLYEIDKLLTAKAGKCADIHSVYVTLSRAAGVPAREVYGIRMPRDKEGDITKFQHCWAEFYLPGYGWMVVDPADVLKFELEKNPAPDELNAKRAYFFGAVDENRIALNSGKHVTLNPSQNGGPLLYFMYPYAEIDGKPLNEDLFGFNIGYKIMFREQ
ncbi:MAG: transglutaminase domain-containing protein [Nitrospirae bacterium]|nr:transglutaminase domain-containing protein [Nitrospirota bacterium]